MGNYFDVFLFLATAITFVFFGLWVAKLVRPALPNTGKQSIFECGERPFGDSRLKFRIRYYIFALVFVVFDVEAIFLYPWAVVFRDIGLAGFIEMLVFIGVLVAGLIYAWKKKVLQWV
ncbi:MAG: NADH-quinone oxidoreductase subunit A [Alicyclobacillus sp.]|nr:NADH-quinone oxidoreductase subunit A [Alicyclobacillus sp.]